MHTFIHTRDLQASDIREKDHMERGLAGELAKMPKSVNRQTYVKRIMDIVKNLDKQKLGTHHT